MIVLKQFVFPSMIVSNQIVLLAMIILKQICPTVDVFGLISMRSWIVELASDRVLLKHRLMRIR